MNEDSDTENVSVISTVYWHITIFMYINYFINWWIDKQKNFFDGNSAISQIKIGAAEKYNFLDITDMQT